MRRVSEQAYVRANLYTAIWQRWRRSLPSVFSRRFYTPVRQVQAVVNAITCFSHKRDAVVAAAKPTGSRSDRSPNCPTIWSRLSCIFKESAQTYVPLNIKRINVMILDYSPSSGVQCGNSWQRHERGKRDRVKPWIKLSFLRRLKILEAFTSALNKFLI